MSSTTNATSAGKATSREHQDSGYLPPEHQLHTFGPFHFPPAMSSSQVEQPYGPSIPLGTGSFALPFTTDRKVEINNLQICAEIAALEASTIRLIYVKEGQTPAEAETANQHIADQVRVDNLSAPNTWVNMVQNYDFGVLPPNARIYIQVDNDTGPDVTAAGILIRFRTHTNIR